jgi:hypothetical protein
MNSFLKDLFGKLDNLHNEHKTNDIVVYNRTTKRYNIVRSDIPVERAKSCVEKYDTIQDYKRAYYLKNIETYRLRNEEYRKRKKAEKKNII